MMRTKATVTATARRALQASKEASVSVSDRSFEAARYLAGDSPGAAGPSRWRPSRNRSLPIVTA